MATERAPHNMTADNAPSPYVAAASTTLSGFHPYWAFDGALGSGHYWLADGVGTGWLSMDFGAGNTFVITNYNVVVNTIPEPNRAPKDWTLEGSNDNSSWTTLDTQTSQTSWTSGQNRAFTCSAPGTVAWRYIRINISANNGDTYLQMGELYLQGEPAPGDITFDTATDSGDQVSVSSYSLNRTSTGANRYLRVSVTIAGTIGSVTSITDDNGGGNVAMSRVGSPSVGATSIVEVWQLAAPVSGTKSVAVVLSGSLSSRALASSYNGVHQTSPSETYNTSTGGSGPSTATLVITPVTNGCWPCAAIASDDSAITAGQISRNNVNFGAGIYSGADEDTGAQVNPAAATNMTYSGIGTLNNWAMAGYAIRPVSASGGAVNVNSPSTNIIWTAVAPIINRTQSIKPPAANIAWSAVAPAIRQPHNIAIPPRNVLWAAFAPVVNRTQSIAPPAANVTWAARAPTITQAHIVNIPAANVTWAALAPIVNRTQSVAVPAANVTWAASGPSIVRGHIVYPPAANVTWTAKAPVVNRTQSLGIPAANILWTALPPIVTVGGRPTWGTFPQWPKHQHYPAWWPAGKKKIEDELEERIDAIVEAAEPKAERSPSLAAALAEIRRLEAGIVAEQIATGEIERQIREALTARQIRLTNEASRVVDKVVAAKREADAEVEAMEVRRKQIRRKKIMHILQSLQ